MLSYACIVYSTNRVNKSSHESGLEGGMPLNLATEKWFHSLGYVSGDCSVGAFCCHLTILQTPYCDQNTPDKHIEGRVGFCQSTSRGHPSASLRSLPFNSYLQVEAASDYSNPCPILSALAIHDILDQPDSHFTKCLGDEATSGTTPPTLPPLPQHILHSILYFHLNHRTPSLLFYTTTGLFSLITITVFTIKNPT